MPAPFSYAPRLAGVPVLWNIMKIDIVSVFPEYFEVLNLSLLGKAQEKGLVEVTAHNLRDWTHDVHHSVDDTPVGGGAGMVMKPEVWSECLDELLHLEPTTVTCDSTADADDTASADAAESAESATEIAANADTVPATDRPVLIFPNPSAPLFTQQDATELSHTNHLLFGCGRYEGYDARIPQYYRAQGVDVREYSIGDYVLNGGEVAVSVMLEAITRLLPGFMGNAARSWRNRIRERTPCWSTASIRSRPIGAVSRFRTSCCPATTRRSTVSAAMRRWRRPTSCVRISSRRWIVPSLTRPIAKR